jgi:hypothetical protein
MNLELNTALNTAETAVSFHQFTARMFVPAAGGLVIEVRAVLFYEGFVADRGYCHIYRPRALP